MSQWHARDGVEEGDAYNIIFHIPIPSANNRVAVNYQAAIVGSGIGGTTAMTEGSSAGQITTAEKASITSGSILEVAETFNTNLTENASELAARVNARYAELSDPTKEFMVNLKRRLDYWGAASSS